MSEQPPTFPPGAFPRSFQWGVAASAYQIEGAVRRYDGWHNRWFLDPLAGRGYPKDMVRW